MVARQEGQIRGGGGLRLHTRGWLPDRRPYRATILLSHGLGEHSGRYDHVGEALANAGFAVWALDHRGHGRSDGTRVYVERFSSFVADLETFRLLIRSFEPRLPSFLLGHSMGGAIALAHAIDRPGCFAGLVLSGPAMQPQRGVGRATIGAGRLAARLAPKAGVIALDAKQVSRDPAVVAAYRHDPLVHHGKVTARLGAELLDRAARFPDELPRLRLPVLLLHGDADGLVPVEGSRELFPLIGSADKTFIEYPGLFHEILNEPERNRVLDDIVAWVDARVGARATMTGA